MWSCLLSISPLNRNQIPTLSRMGNHAQAPQEMAWGSLLLCGSERRVNVTNDLQISHGDQCNLFSLSNHCGQHVQHFFKSLFNFSGVTPNRCQ